MTPFRFLRSPGFFIVFAALLAAAPVQAATPLTFESLYDPARLIRVEITLPEADWDALRMQNRSMAEAMAKDRHPDSAESPFDYFKADIVIDGQTIKDVGLRKKGFVGSLDRHRPSLKISFDKYVKGRTVAGQEKLTLNNNKQDPSAMNQAIAYKVFRDAGIAAPRANHAHVTVNGEDLGIYSNVESVEEEFLKRRFEGKPGHLYEGTVTDFLPGWANKFETKTGKENDYSDVQSVINALEADDAHLLTELREVVDLDQFLDFWAVEVLLQHWDGYAGNRNNFFIYRPKGSDQFVFLPWGADMIAAKNPFWQFTPPKSVYAGSELSRRLYNHPEGRELYRRNLREVLNQAWDAKALTSEVDRIQALTGDFLKEDPRYESTVESLKTFLAGRKAEVLAELDGPAPDWTWPPATPPYVKKAGTVAGTFTAKWGSLMGNPFADSEATLEFKSDEAVPEFSKIAATAGPSQQAENKGDPSIRIAARTGSSPKMTMVNFGIAPGAFQPGDHDVDMTQIFGMAFEIDPSGGGFKFIGLLQGTLTLDTASREKDGPVSGRFHADVLSFSGMGGN